MLWRGNEEKDPVANGENKSITPEQTDTVQKVLEDVKTLRETLVQLKAKRDDINNLNPEPAHTEPKEETVNSEPAETADHEAVAAAHRAILEQARLDAQEEHLRQYKLKEREAQKIIEQREAQKILEEKKREILRLRQTQIEAERKAAAARRKQTLELKDAAKEEEKKTEIPAQILHQREAERTQQRQQELERRRQEDHEKLLAQQRKLLQQQRKLLQDEQRKAREHQRREQEQQRKRERQQLIEEERALQRQKREEATQEIRKIKAEQEAQRRSQRQERSRKQREERAQKAEKKQQENISAKAAEMGGGIVKVHGVSVKTEMEPVAAFSLKEFLGFVSRKEKQSAKSAEELQALIEERERTKEEARQVAARLSQLRSIRRQNSELGRRYRSFRTFCEERKKPLLVAFAAVLIALVCTAGIFNFFTAYEYSYNGKPLGYVNNKDSVLQITGIVQNALTEEKNMNVVIDAGKDVSFRRVTNFNKELTIDSSDDVLRRLTYMGDLNVKAYGIYIDGKRVGAVQDKETAAKVLQDIKDKYVSKKSNSEVEEAVIVENIEIRKANADLQDIKSEEQMVDRLCENVEKETVHKVVAGETLASIATDYGTTEKKLIKDNGNIDPDNPEVGSSVIIRANAPVMTVKITEVRTYDHKIKYETEKKKDKEMYEGYSEVDQEGKNGLETLTDRTISINGEVTETKTLKQVIKKEPVTKIVRIGTKERPPTVGCGKLIWPAESGTYTITSEFKWRWGRHHDGIDMACHVGNKVMAADGGTVTYAGYMGGYGNLVIIDHQNGMETYYGHNSSLTVSVGDKVFQTQQIAYSGNTGFSTGPHIHFGVKVNGSFVNPRDYIVD